MHLNPLKIKYLPKAINVDITNEILRLAKSAPNEDAEVADIVDGKYVKIKHNENCNASLVNYSTFTDKVNDLVDRCAVLVKEQTGLTCVDKTIEFVHYTTGTKYWPHIDGQTFIKDTNTLTRGNVKRDITCVVYFNEDYTGGELYFQFFNTQYTFKAGDVIIYPSSWQYIHGVEPVIGERYALVIWFETTPHAYPLADETITNPVILKTLRTEKRI